jgi:nitric-oxide synthase, bacterial
VRDLNIETLILRHAPLFDHLLMQKKELKFRRTLSLPLGTSALPWLEPEAIAEALSKWLHGEINNQPPEIFTGSSQLSGADIALELSAMLRQSMSAQQFARLRFEAIDLDRSGQIDAQQLLPYLLDLGYSQDECQSILEQADKDGKRLLFLSLYAQIKEGVSGGSSNSAIANFTRSRIPFQSRSDKCPINIKLAEGGRVTKSLAVV